MDIYFSGAKDSNETIDKEYNTLKKMGKAINRQTLDLFDSKPSLLIPNQAQFHVLKYVKGLIKAIVRLGGKIYCHTHVTQIAEGLVKTKNGKEVKAKSIIVATMSPINDRVIIHTKQHAYRTYVIASLIPKNSVPRGLFWDTENPYHYVRTHPHDQQNDWLIIGGNDHKVGQEPNPESKYEQLEKWARKRLKFDKIDAKWSGQVFDAIDSIGFIGQNPLDKNVYIATGDTGNGMTHGTIAGILIPDLILENPNPWAKLYDPSRKTLKCASTYIEENLNTFAQYGDWLTPGDKRQIEEMAPESGIVIRNGIKKLAVYKDKNNQVHTCSAFCPHLGACVRWNPAEKSWDCPAHGSRFNGCGKVITSPSISNLS